MIPVEKIAGGTLNNVVLYVGIVGLLLVAAALIRLKVPFLRKAFIPASLLAGLIGMILGPYFLKVIPADMMSSIGALPTPMITIVFACMLLGIKKEEAENALKKNDKRRKNFYNALTTHEWGDPKCHDLYMNAGNLGIDLCVGILTEAAKG